MGPTRFLTGELENKTKEGSNLHDEERRYGGIFLPITTITPYSGLPSPDSPVQHTCTYLETKVELTFPSPRDIVHGGVFPTSNIPKRLGM